jgi:redox-sensitive bicupin YhaK (pirin superfamily)
MSLLINPRVQDIGFPVRRILPARECQRVGPFIFVDHMGPAEFEKGTTAGDVRQHPHIGLSTVTYLFSGAMMHRDSLGIVQRIEPGAINLMTAGKGIVHSERMPADIRDQEVEVQGVQTWLALPLEHEEVDPSFEHYAAAQIPSFEFEGGTGKVLIGSLNGVSSPVSTYSPASYFELFLEPFAEYQLSLTGQELAVYIAKGKATVNDTAVDTYQLLVVGDTVSLQAGPDGCHLMILGGEALAGKRYIHWNFVSSSMTRLKQASEDWKEKRFGLVPGETEYIPLPDSLL